MPKVSPLVIRESERESKVSSPINKSKKQGENSVSETTPKQEQSDLSYLSKLQSSLYFEPGKKFTKIEIQDED